MEGRINRRSLLKAGAAFSVVGASQIFTAVPALADFAVGPTVRRNASTMAASDPILRGYRRAITAMKALPNNNPCSWFYQAAIHGTTDPANLPSWNTCHTDPTFFWAWHRMYLYWFERIVRKYAKQHDWAIPYWDWTNPAERAIPAPFRDSASVLFETRNAGMNAGGLLPTSLATSVNNAMTLLDYFNTQSSINGPHGSVHGLVGGKMSSVSSAAQDPIFWAHHAQVDRIWNLWLAQGGGRSSPVGDSVWRNKTYTFFDECCQSVTMKGCDVVRAALQLSYTYEGEPPQVNQYCPLIWNPQIFEVATLAQFKPALQLGPRPVRTPLLPRDAREASRRIRDMASTAKGNLALHIRGIEADTQPGISWEVHVGRKGFTPSSESLVGIFALFGAGLRDRREHFHPAEFVFPIGKALRNVDPATLEVAFVPVGMERDGATAVMQPRSPVRIGEIAIIVDSPMPQLPRDEQEKLRRQEESE
ncbi:MAG TPA: tyrosinase family protein [Allosphingosinicella sp.]|nr:tyrosinase family protein [Allosphingosinicella sp.]